MKSDALWRVQVFRLLYSGATRIVGALYGRVSSESQDVDLSIPAKFAVIYVALRKPMVVRF
jgi:hypothetical protein